MCGLVGVAGNLLKKDTDFFKQALICDQLRGSHSTGIITVDNKNDCYTYKSAKQGADFVKTADFVAANTINQKILAGHNRYATQGEVNDDNAHPFHHGDVVLMHNGTLYSREGLRKDKVFEVDSEHIAYSIGNAENDAEIIDILEALDGAFVLIWFNLRSNKLYMARNDERPLSIAVSGNRMYWASEEKMLDWLLDRNNVIQYDIVDLPEGELRCFDFSGNRISTEKTPFKPADSYGGYNWRYPSYPTYNKALPPAEVWYECRFTSFTSFQDGERGNAYGYDINTGQSVALYNVLKQSLGWDPVDGSKIDENWVYCMKSFSRSNIQVMSLETADSTRYYAEKGSNVIDLVNVGGKMVSRKESDELKDRGCGMCGNPFTEDELADLKRDEDGILYHADTCYDTAMKLFGEYDEAF